MKNRYVRVVLASEQPETRQLLRKAIEKEEGNVIIGEADNAPGALVLARNLRPDLAIFDCYLPYTVGLNNLQTSRIGGLDAAQIINQEIPNMNVVLLNNLDADTLLKRGLDAGEVVVFAKRTDGSMTTFKLKELHERASEARQPIFAEIDFEQRSSVHQKVINISDKAVMLGGLGLLGGVFLMLTIIFSGAGIYLAAAGIITAVAGFLGRFSSRLFFKPSGKADKNDKETR